MTSKEKRYAMGGSALLDEKIERLLDAAAELAREEEALAMYEKTPDALIQEDVSLADDGVDETPLPPAFRRGLQALLADIRDQAPDDGDQPSAATDIAAEAVSTEDIAEVALAEPDVGAASAAGADVHMVGVAHRYQSFALLPHWVQPDGEGQGSVSLPVAAMEVKEAHTFDFRDAGYDGAVSCELQLETEYEGEGLLRFRWSADHVPAEGWWVAVYTDQDSAPCFEELLGLEAKGEVVFPAALLGFDPTKTPFRYMLYPR